MPRHAQGPQRSPCMRAPRDQEVGGLMDKFVVTIYAIGGKLMERVGGFTSRDEANEYAAKEFTRGDVGSVHVQLEITSGGNGRWH